MDHCGPPTEGSTDQARPGTHAHPAPSLLDVQEAWAGRYQPAVCAPRGSSLFHRLWCPMAGPQPPSRSWPLTLAIRVGRRGCTHCWPRGTHIASAPSADQHSWAAFRVSCRDRSYSRACLASLRSAGAPTALAIRGSATLLAPGPDGWPTEWNFLCAILQTLLAGGRPASRAAAYWPRPSDGPWPSHMAEPSRHGQHLSVLPRALSPRALLSDQPSWSLS
jgi:hypothetical protein